MKISNIKYNDIANGTGVRNCLFVSGCRHKCKGCFNAIAWDFNHGYDFDEKVISEFIEKSKPEYISGITLLGGEPLEPENWKELLPFLKRFKAEVNKSVWCYTGFLFEQVHDLPIMNYIDVLVDGKFEIENKSLTLKFRGSSNQRIIDVKNSTLNDIKILKL